MSQAEDLLNSLTTDGEVEEHIVIGNDRFITVPQSLKKIAVQFDNNVRTVTFDCPRYSDGRDLSTMTISINYMRPDGDPGLYQVEAVTIDENDDTLIHFDWVIKDHVTEVNGTLSFLVCAKKTNSDGTNENHWNSELNQEMTISKGLNCNTIIIEKTPDLITQILVRLDDVETREVTTDKTLTESEKPADSKVVGDKINELKGDLNDINQKQGQMTFSVIKNSYYKLDGTYEKYGGWLRTPLLTLPNTKKLTFDNTETALSKYNCFYDENRIFISSFRIQKGYYNDSVDIPSNAKFVGFSGEVGFINGLKVSFVETGENVVREKVGINTKLRVCSFNVGLWTDGVSSNARVADEDVPKASVALRRFIGESNADFILCEEATHEFDKSMTIDAYTQCFENNLPYGWKTSESGNWEYVRQMLLASKYKIVNVKAHEYKCGSTRGYATFDASICGKYVTFIVCHLSTESNSDGLRQQEMEELKSVMNDYEYSILCGDFNAYSIDEFTNHFGDFNIANHGYFGDFTTWPVDGWESWNHCLDNIITTKNITIENVYMGNVDMSDHRPLIADLLIN